MNKTSIMFLAFALLASACSADSSVSPTTTTQPTETTSTIVIEEITTTTVFVAPEPSREEFDRQVTKVAETPELQESVLASRSAATLNDIELDIQVVHIEDANRTVFSINAGNLDLDFEAQIFAIVGEERIELPNSQLSGSSNRGTELASQYEVFEILFFDLEGNELGSVTVS